MEAEGAEPTIDHEYYENPTYSATRHLLFDFDNSPNAHSRYNKSNCQNRTNFDAASHWCYIANYAVDSDGTLHYGNPTMNSIKSYLMDKLTDESTLRELKTLAVDMLNYGAAAQVNFNYDAENLVNADLTEAQKALGTIAIPDANNNIAESGVGSSITANVSLQSKSCCISIVVMQETKTPIWNL